jgi:multiple sugar transport system permease protein
MYEVFMAQAIPRRRPTTTAIREHMLWGRIPVSWLYLLPALFFFAGWQLYPILRVGWLSLTDYYFLKDDGNGTWVGLKNYREALSDPLVRQGLWRATKFTALFLPGMIFLPMILAVMVDRYRNPKVATFLRLVLLIPAMIPGPLVFVLWKWMYDLYIGPINYLLVDVTGLFTLYNQPQWLGDKQLVFPAIAVMAWWWGLGYHTMFYLAGLATIPRDLYEAARVDGANEWSLFWNVTFQRLRPVILVLVVLRFGTAMAAIDEFIILGGGAGNMDRPTFTWTVYMRALAFEVGDWHQSYAAAVGWIGTFAMLIVVIGMFRLFRSRD